MSTKSKSKSNPALETATKVLFSTLEQTPPPTPPVKALCDELGFKYKVSSETLRSRHKRSQKHQEKKHGNRLLTDKQEASLVATILACEQLGQPLSQNQVWYWLHCNIVIVMIHAFND